MDLSTYVMQSSLCLYFYYVCYLWKPDCVDLAKIQFNKTFLSASWQFQIWYFKYHLYNKVLTDDKCTVISNHTQQGALLCMD